MFLGPKNIVSPPLRINVRYYFYDRAYTYTKLSDLSTGCLLKVTVIFGVRGGGCTRTDGCDTDDGRRLTGRLYWLTSARYKVYCTL